MIGRPVEFAVEGDPAAQGSKRAVGTRRNGTTILVEQSKRVRPWRDRVAHVARQYVGTFFGSWTPLSGPLRVRLTFYLPRPRSVPRSRRWRPHVRPDIDKLARAALDALSDAHIWDDDGQVVDLHATKHYDDARSAGMHVVIERIGEGS